MPDAAAAPCAAIISAGGAAYPRRPTQLRINLIAGIKTIVMIENPVCTVGPACSTSADERQCAWLALFFCQTPSGTCCRMLVVAAPACCCVAAPEAEGEEEDRRLAAVNEVPRSATGLCAAAAPAFSAAFFSYCFLQLLGSYYTI